MLFSPYQYDANIRTRKKICRKHANPGNKHPILKLNTKHRTLNTNLPVFQRSLPGGAEGTAP